MNTLKVFVLLAGLTALFGAIGGAIGGTSGAVLALGFAAVMNVVMYYASGTMVLKSYRAQVVTAAEAPKLYAMVDRLRQRAGLPMPVVAIAPHDQPNAFATGRNPEHAVVCVTEGLLRVMNQAELEGVIAHELAHIKNRDMLLMTIAATIAGAISNLAQFGFLLGGRDEDGNANPVTAIAMMILGPLAAMLLQSAISRTREFKADAVGAEIAGSPDGLASALATLERASQRIPMQVSPAAASMAIVNPLSAFRGQALVKLFSTHPPTAERIEALAQLR
ncbi:MAG: zinc metalloprotease HtpX [Gemmatimonadaceae bacterium]|nr:zinc metalloprotease HtpX [Gemmatimonadaceae bacterium]